MSPLTTMALVCFWLSAALVLYAYVGYPLLVVVLGRLTARPGRRRGYQGPVRSVSVILPVHNEQATIAGRIEELSRLLAGDDLAGELIVVADGCTDATVAIARQHASERVHLIELPQSGGKAAALNAGCAIAANQVLVFADARQTWAPDALTHLIEPFVDPAVGAVSGELVLESAPGVTAGVGLYWRYEKWLRRQESHLHSQVGVTGAICAVRRNLYRPLPPGTILDDVYWPLVVVMRGYRVVHQSAAKAFDRLPARAGDEFRRKVRTLCGSLQLAARLPAVLLPWRNPLCLQFISHKLTRLLVPWALVAMLLLSPFLPGRFYGGLFAVQFLSYGLALAGLWPRVSSHSRIASAAASFLLLNAAAMVAFWVWITGRSTLSWRKATYQPSPASLPLSGERPWQATVHP